MTNRFGQLGPGGHDRGQIERFGKLVDQNLGLATTVLP
jgi:hypothetical protein